MVYMASVKTRVRSRSQATMMARIDWGVIFAQMRSERCQSESAWSGFREHAAAGEQAQEAVEGRGVARRCLRKVVDVTRAASQLVSDSQLGRDLQRPRLDHGIVELQELVRADIRLLIVSH